MWVRFRLSLLYVASTNRLSVSSLTVGPRVGEAMWRTIRWLDRCIEHHEKSGRTDVQNLFAIVQGGLDSELRDKCLDEMIARKNRVAGYAIGGLSGGEEKGQGYSVTPAATILNCYSDVFWRVYVQAFLKSPKQKLNVGLELNNARIGFHGIVRHVPCAYVSILISR